MKIKTVIEDHPNADKDFAYEHGISVLFKADNVEYLFDTGLTGLLMENFPKLNEDPNKIQTVVLSHGHNDHAGGLITLLKGIETKPDIYLGEGFYNPKYKILPNGELEFKSCGFVEEDLKDYNVVVVDKKDTKLSEHVHLFSRFQATNDFEHIPDKYVIKRNDMLEEDLFREEIAIGINTPEGLVLIVGCSHIGIVNICHSILKNHRYRIRGIIGGTHLINCTDERLEKTLDYLKKLDLEFLAVSHCTGDMNFERIKEVFKDKFIFNTSGNIIEI